MDCTHTMDIYLCRQTGCLWLHNVYIVCAVCGLGRTHCSDFEARQKVLTDLWTLQDDGKPSIEVGCLPDTQGGGPVYQTVEGKAFQQAKLFLEHFTVTM